MELVKLKPGEPLYEGGGPPSLFFCGYWDGYAHLLRFGAGEGVDDAVAVCEKQRAQWGRKKRLDFRGGMEPQ